MPLTVKECNEKIAETGTGMCKLADGHGLYLFIKNGKASWTWQYRTVSGWSSKGFGPYPKISPKQAREEAEAYRVALRSGTAMMPVPQPRKTTAKTVVAASGVTFADGLNKWLDANPKGWVPKSIKQRRVLARLSLAPLDIARITQADVRTALANETPRQHQDKRGWLAAFFSHAKVQGWRNGENPARFDADTQAGFAKVPDSEHFKAVPVADLPAVFAKLASTPVGDAVRFQILTAARPGATEAATWSEIKGDNGTSSWEYTVLKGDKPFLQRVPLTKAALDLIGERKADDAPLFVLKANQMLDAIKKASGDDDMTVHGTAKSTFRQWCDDTGVDEGLAKAATAHYRGDKVQRSYSRGDLYERRRKVMQDWADFVTGTA